jgi:hypothetical protein
MEKDYQSPEAVEIGKADSIILGEKDVDAWDQPTMSFIKTPSSAVDVDE